MTASEGRIGHTDFSNRSLLRVGELIEVVPAMIATQHSGAGKANQYFLRGFNLDHGTDFAGFFDGVPTNMPTHGHGQGYLDFNFIIPETIESIAYYKGPYHTKIGNFSSAGSVQFKTYDRLERGIAQAAIGEGNYFRALLVNSQPFFDGDFLYAVEGQYNDGPWRLNENLEKTNLLIKYAGHIGDFHTRIAGMAYHAKWDATDQIPQRAVEQGIISHLGYIDPNLGGKTTRLGLSANFTTEGLQARAYSIYYDFSLFSNFTYFLDDPINGDEFEQADERWIIGGSIEGESDHNFIYLPVILRAGLDIRYDNVLGVGLYKTKSRSRLARVRDDSIDEVMMGLYGEAEVRWNDRLRTYIGFRTDILYYNVDSYLNPNSGNGTDAIISPKFGLAYMIGRHAEFYLNYGFGFHSNDMRGKTISIDQISGKDATSVNALVRSEGAEVGLRYEPINDLTLTLSGYWLDLDSELVFVGDAGVTEPNAATRRYGTELAVLWHAGKRLVFDLSGGISHSRYRGVGRNDRIPNSIGFVAGVGVYARLPYDISVNLRLRHLGASPLVEDNSIRSNPTTLVNLGMTKHIGPIDVELEVFNLFNSRDSDITYYYESRLLGEAVPVPDIHFHPVEPLTLRVKVQVSF